MDVDGWQKEDAMDDGRRTRTQRTQGQTQKKRGSDPDCVWFTKEDGGCRDGRNEWIGGNGDVGSKWGWDEQQATSRRGGPGRMKRI
jgi:hypothetical protein